MKVYGKKIIVTGAGAGIGRELTLQLLHMGATVAGLDINEKGLEETKKIAKNSDKLTTHKVDITDYKALEKFKKEYLKLHGEIDGLINNAGVIQPFIPVSELDAGTIDWVMDVNFFGPVNLTRLFIHELKERPEAHIVNVSSMGGFFPFPGQTMYGASKAALKLFTEGLYAESLGTNLNVTIVFPGAVATDIAKNSGTAKENDSTASNYKMLPPQQAAFYIIEAMEQNKFQAFVGSDSKFMNFMYKMNPKKAINFIINKMSKM